MPGASMEYCPERVGGCGRGLCHAGLHIDQHNGIARRGPVGGLVRHSPSDRSSLGRRAEEQEEQGNCVVEEILRFSYSSYPLVALWFVDASVPNATPAAFRKSEGGVPPAKIQTKSLGSSRT